MKKEKPDLVASLDSFIEAFSYPAEHGLLVRNLPEHAVHARADRGNAAAYFTFPDIKNLEAHVSEIPPGTATPTHRHTGEAFFYVIAGGGYTEVCASGEMEQRVEWQAGDLFCTPQQTWHRHVNSDPSRPARYLEITDIPLMKSLGNWRIEAGDDNQALGKIQRD
ncbi:MAG TPA: cupin domain-containing protein [Pyrinomonadaceae bacterium]|jgi:quercetin dioxygenase-like cupin family protein|nr:cupin domain-containing protein [Pyrinomonadaceae bacterium]